MSDRRAARALIALAILASTAACGTAQPSVAPATAAASAVQAPPNPALLEFEQRVADAVARDGQLVRGLTAASVGSRGQLGLVARQMTEWATDELAWIDDHPPEACFQEAAAAFKSGMTDILSAATAFAKLAAASGPPSDEEGGQAGQLLSNGTASLEEAAALAKSARAACR